MLIHSRAARGFYTKTNEIEADVVWLVAVNCYPRDGPQVRGEGMKTGKWMIIEEGNYISVSN